MRSPIKSGIKRSWTYWKKIHESDITFVISNKQVLIGSASFLIDKNSLKDKKYNKLDKGAWGMPRLSEAKKDAISCEKLRGSAHTM